MEKKSLKGSIDFELTYDDKEYTISYSKSVNNEMAAILIARELSKYCKANLLTHVENAKGKQKGLAKDRMSKMTTTEYTLGMMGVDYLHFIQRAEEAPVESEATEPSIEVPAPEATTEVSE